MSIQTNRKMPVNQTKQKASTSAPNNERRASNASNSTRRYTGEKKTQNATPNTNSNRNANGRNTRKNAYTSNNIIRNPNKQSAAVKSNNGATSEISATVPRDSSTTVPKDSSDSPRKNWDIKHSSYISETILNAGNTAPTNQAQNIDKPTTSGNSLSNEHTTVAHHSPSISETMLNSGNGNTNRKHRSNSEPTKKVQNVDKPTTSGKNILNEHTTASHPTSAIVSEQPSQSKSNDVHAAKEEISNVSVESRRSDGISINATAPMKVFPSFRGEYPTRHRHSLDYPYWPQRAGGKPVLQENESEFEQRAERGCTTVTETHYLSINCPTAAAVAHNTTAIANTASVIDGNSQTQAILTSHPIASNTNAYEDIITYAAQPPQPQTYRVLQQDQAIRSSTQPQQYNNYWEPAGAALNIPCGGTWPTVNIPTIQSYVGDWSQAGHPPQQAAYYPNYQENTHQQQQLYSNAWPQQRPMLQSEIPAAAGVSVARPCTATNPMYAQVLVVPENAAIPDEGTINQPQYLRISPNVGIDVPAATAPTQIHGNSSAQPRANIETTQQIRWEQNQVPRLLREEHQQAPGMFLNQQTAQQPINNPATPCDAQATALRITAEAQQQVTQAQQHIAQLQQSLNNNNACSSTLPIQDVPVGQSEIQHPQQQQSSPCICSSEPMQQQTVQQQRAAPPLQQQQQQTQIQQQSQAPEQTQQQTQQVQQIAASAALQQQQQSQLQQQCQAPIISSNEQTQQQSQQQQQTVACAPFQQPPQQNQQPVTYTVYPNVQQQQQTLLPATQYEQQLPQQNQQPVTSTVYPNVQQSTQYEQLNPLQMMQNGNNIYDLNNQNSIMFQQLPLMIPPMNQYHMMQTLPPQSPSHQNPMQQCIFPMFAPLQGAPNFNGMQQQTQYSENGSYGPQTAPLQAHHSFGHSQHQPNNHQCYSPRCRQRHGRYGNTMSRWR